MTDWQRAKIRVLSALEGGRQSGPPSGLMYFPTAVPDSAFPADVFTAGVMFSLEIEMGPEGEAGWRDAKVRALIDGSPGSEALRPEAVLAILEGTKKVAVLIVE